MEFFGKKASFFSFNLKPRLFELFTLFRKQTTFHPLAAWIKCSIPFYQVQRKHVYDLRQLILTGDIESCSQHVFQWVPSWFSASPFVLLVLVDYPTLVAFDMHYLQKQCSWKFSFLFVLLLIKYYNYSLIRSSIYYYVS